MTNLIQSMAMVILSLYTTFKQFISPHMILFMVVVIIFILHRINSKQTTKAPLFSFPSLSQPLISVSSISLSQPLSSFRSISYPLVSFPSLSLQPIRFRAPPSKKDFEGPDSTDVESPLLPSKPVVVILDSVSYQDHNIYTTIQSTDEEGRSGTLDETWNSIVATGKAKPVRLFTRSQREGNPKRKTKKSTMENRKEKKKTTESTSYESVERRALGSSTEGTTSISSDELPHHNNLGIEKH